MRAWEGIWAQKAWILFNKVATPPPAEISFEDLPAALERLRKDGVKVTQKIKSAFNGKVKFAFIEGPDRIRIELVEGQARKE